MIVQIWYRLATNRIETLWDSQKADLCFRLYILMVIDFAVTVENIQNGRRSGGALVRNMASEF